MMDHILHVLVFSAEVILIVVSIIVVMAFFFHFLGQSKRTKKTMEVEHINEKVRSNVRLLQQNILNKKQLRTILKAQKKKLAKEQKADGSTSKPRIFMVDFLGDIQAHAVDGLREELTAILAVAQPQDEVLVRVESAGGVVHGYGLAAAQLMRVREHGVRLTVAVDKIAASGGYMMACVGERILAAPFAIIGSIGVVAPVPNFNRLLRKHQIEYKEYTAGDFKRTVSILGENTPQGIAKFNEQLQDTHVLFKDFIRSQRPTLNVDQVATGEHWYAKNALTLGLIDEISTSDEYLMKRLETHELYKVTFFVKRKLAEKLADVVGQGALKIWTKLEAESARARYQ